MEGNGYGDEKNSWHTDALMAVPIVYECSASYVNTNSSYYADSQLFSLLSLRSNAGARLCLLHCFFLNDQRDPAMFDVMPYRGQERGW